MLLKGGHKQSKGTKGKQQTIRLQGKTRVEPIPVPGLF